MLLFDVCNPTSLENAEFKWLEEVRHFLPRVPIILCGNKTDLRNDPKTLNDLSRFGQKPVTYEQGMATARRMQVNDYMESLEFMSIGLPIRTSLLSSNYLCLWLEHSDVRKSMGTLSTTSICFLIRGSNALFFCIMVLTYFEKILELARNLSSFLPSI